MTKSIVRKAFVDAVQYPFSSWNISIAHKICVTHSDEIKLFMKRYGLKKNLKIEEFYEQVLP